jgi:hypothetical protein
MSPLQPDDMIICDCGTDAIAIYDDPEFDFVELTMWQAGQLRLRWRTRIHFAWGWLRGDPQALNSVVLTPAELKRFIEALRRTQVAQR